MINVSHLCVQLGKKPILDDISLTIKQGQSLSILGPSGSGKTSLLKAIAGFLPIQQGNIFIDGKCVHGSAVFIPPQKRRCVLLFQDSALWPHMTIDDHLNFALKTSRQSLTSQCLDFKKEILTAVGLMHRTNAFPRNLSGGEKQRLALGRALLTKPTALLLDEPFSSLDLQQKIAMTNLLKETRQRYGFSVIHITHDPFEARHISDHVALLEQGRIIWQGTTRGFQDSLDSELHGLVSAMAIWQKFV